MNTFRIKTSIQFGKNALEFLEQLGKEKILIVTDPFMIESGMINQVTSHLQQSEYAIFSDVVPDPPMELVVKGVEEVIRMKPSTIIALGGGSAIDEAKAIMKFSKQIGNLTRIKLVAIPTTSGTGSEVTSFSVITDREKGKKYPLVSEELLPDVAILETELVRSVPPSITADTGMDVLTHAIEAYVSTAATEFSDAFAQKAVELVFEYLIRSYRNKEDTEAREKMHYASCLAGMAFNLASLGLNHAIAHNIGGKLHIPHGRTNTILLPYVMEFNADINGYHPEFYTTAAKKYAYLAKLIGLTGSSIRILVKNFTNEIKKLQKEMNIPVRLSECTLSTAITDKIKDEIATGALEDACIKTNPRITTKENIIDILKQVV